MIQTFKEILEGGDLYQLVIEYPQQDNLQPIKNYVIDLLKLVREKTIQECIESAVVDFVKDDVAETLEVYLINSSLDNLDKNSINI